MELFYYKIIVIIKGRLKALGGIRRYPITDLGRVQQIVWQGLLKYYEEKDILKIDIWPMSEHSQELKEFLEKGKFEK